MARWAQEDLKARDAFRKAQEKETKAPAPDKKMKKQDRELMAEIDRIRKKQALDRKHAARIRTSIRR